MLRRFIVPVLLVACSFLGSGLAKGAVTLPAPNPGVTSLKFDDFDVYSLALLNFIATGKTNFPASSPYYVASSPGKIVTPPDAVIGTGPGGNANNHNAEMDNAFNTPNSGGPNSIQFFQFLSTNEPNPVITNDQSGAWDTQISTLIGPQYLNGSDLVFYFNMNETGTLSQLAGQDLLAYATVVLDDTNGANPDKVFTLSGSNTTLPGQSYSNSNRSNWAYVHSEITVDPVTRTFIHLGPPTDADKLLGYTSVVQNLGAANAAFAAYNKELNEALYSGTYEVMRVYLELGEINNGYEQVFIRQTNVEGDIAAVPEPTTLVVWGGLTMAGLLVGRLPKRRMTK